MSSSPLLMNNNLNVLFAEYQPLLSFGLFRIRRLISLENISCVDLVNDVVEACVITVGYDGLAL